MTNKRKFSFVVVSLFAAFTSFSVFAESALSSVSANLVNAAGKSVEAEAVENAPIVLVYYSAHWCPPCRKFTPKLVDFYNKNGGGEAFEIVFASSDRSAEDMFHYMEDAHMPWLAIDYDKINETGIKSHGGPYIPSLVMFNEAGEVVAQSYDEANDDYKGPEYVLKKLKKELE